MKSDDENRFDKLLVFLASNYFLDNSELLNLHSEKDIVYSVDPETAEILSARRKKAEDTYYEETEYIGKSCYSTICGRAKLCDSCKLLCFGKSRSKNWIEKSEITGDSYIVHGKGKQGKSPYARITMNHIRSANEAFAAQSNEAETKDFLIDIHTILSQTHSEKYTERFTRMLDLGVEFFDCDGIFLFLYGKKPLIFTDTSSASKNNHSMEEEYSIKSYRKLQKLIGEDGVCCMENAEKVSETDPEMYELLKIWQVDNLLLVPLFKKHKLMGFLLLKNIRRNRHQAAALSSISNVVAGIQLEYELSERMHAEEAKKRARKDTLVKEVLSSSYALLLHVDLTKGTYKAFHHDDELINSLIPREGYLSKAMESLLSMVDDDYLAKITEFCNVSTLKNRLNNQKAIYIDYRTVTHRWARGSIIPVAPDSEGNFTQVIFGLQIIDEEKRRALEQDAKLAYALEEVRDANRAKTYFFRHLSHDIRTPMNAILGLTRIARENMDNREKLEDSLNKISSSSTHLLSLLNDSLDLSRIESGKVVISHERMLVEESVELYKSVINGYLVDRNLDMSWYVQPLPCEGVMADEVHLKRIILNLLSNAIKYTKDGGSVSFRLENSPGSDSRHIKLRYIISDTGVGMTHEFMRHIYEPFSQVEKTGAKSNYAGSGLGMTIVKKYVDFLGGKINIASAPNRGTHITVDFEFEKAAPRTEEEMRNDDCADMDISGKKILIVEDNDINREIARDLLESVGLVVEEAVDGKEAVAIVDGSNPFEFDGILMDVMMPVMDGYAATKKIRKLKRPDTKNMPIIAMTANAFDEDVKRSLSAGMNAHLAKPVDPGRLIYILKKYL